MCLWECTPCVFKNEHMCLRQCARWARFSVHVCAWVLCMRAHHIWYMYMVCRVGVRVCTTVCGVNVSLVIQYRTCSVSTVSNFSKHQIRFWSVVRGGRGACLQCDSVCSVRGGADSVLCVWMLKKMHRITMIHQKEWTMHHKKKCMKTRWNTIRVSASTCSKHKNAWNHNGSP